MELLVTLFLRALAELIWPSKREDGGGSDVFIPFEDRQDAHGDNDSQEGGNDPYFPDGDF